MEVSEETQRAESPKTRTNSPVGESKYSGLSFDTCESNGRAVGVPRTAEPAVEPAPLITATAGEAQHIAEVARAPQSTAEEIDYRADFTGPTQTFKNAILGFSFGFFRQPVIPQSQEGFIAQLVIFALPPGALHLLFAMDAGFFLLQMRFQNDLLEVYDIGLKNVILVALQPRAVGRATPKFPIPADERRKIESLIQRQPEASADNSGETKEV